MKKKYLALIFILVILGVLLTLANIKLPVSLVTKEKINEISNNQVSLLSFSKQYFKLLPMPYIILTDPTLNVKIQKIISKVIIDKIEINRGFFDKENYSIYMNKGFIESLDTDFRNLKIDLSLNANELNLATNQFQLGDSKARFDLLIKNQLQKSLSFNIENLNLKKNYDIMDKLLGYDLLKNIDINEKSSLSIQGIYENDQIIINKANIKISDISSLYIEGIVNLNDPFLSSIKVTMDNIDSTIIDKVVNLLDLNNLLYSAIPKGKISSSKIIIEEGMLDIQLLKYTTNKGNEFSLKSLSPIKDISNPILDLIITIKNFKELTNIQDIILKNDIRNLIDLVNINKGSIHLLLKDRFIEINKMKLITKEEENIFINGTYNTQDKSVGKLKIEIINFSEDKLKKILKSYQNDIFKNYIKLLNFDKINASLVIDTNDQLILITKIELVDDDNISLIDGLYQDQRFAGSMNILDLDLELIDELLLKTKRIKGSLNLDIETNGLISIDSIQNIEGIIDGNINIKIENSEIALLSFLQSLTGDVEDLEALNRFSQIITNSFMNKIVMYEGELVNSTVNELKIENLKFLASDGKIINADIIINGKDFEILLIDVFKDEDFILVRKNGKYNFKRKNGDGIIIKPIEEIIKKNLNQLFKNLLN